MSSILLSQAASEKIQDIFFVLRQSNCVQKIYSEIFSNETPFAEMRLFKRKLTKLKKSLGFYRISLKDSIREHFVLDLEFKKAYRRAPSYSLGQYFLLFQEVPLNSGSKLDVGFAYDWRTEDCSLIAYEDDLDEKNLLKISKEFFHPFLRLEKDFIRLIQKLFCFKLEQELQERLVECGAISSKGFLFENFNETKSCLENQIKDIKVGEFFMTCSISPTRYKEIFLKNPAKNFFANCCVQQTEEGMSLTILDTSETIVDQNLVDNIVNEIEKSLPKIEVTPLNTDALFKKVLQDSLNQEAV